MFRKVLPFILVLLGILLDVSILPALIVDPMLPFFSLSIVMALGMTLGRIQGILIGLFAGLLIDVTVGNPVGLSVITFFIAGYASGFIGASEKKNLLAHVLVPLMCIVVYELAVMLYRYFVSGYLVFGDGFSGLFRIVSGAVLAQGLYLLFSLILKPRRSSYA